MAAALLPEQLFEKKRKSRSPLPPNRSDSGPAEAHGNQLRDTGLLHGHPVKHGSDAHGFLAVGEEYELGLHAHFLDQFGEAADVGFIERGVDFVEDAERAGRVLEDADQQSQRSESL